MTATILRGDALHLPLADQSVDVICTSPPYFGLRSYQDGGKHYAGQLGSEATPAEFVEALLAATWEMVRVLKPSGSIFVNLGDKYAQDTERSRNGHSGALVGTNPLRTGPVYSGNRTNGVPRKSLIGIPWRYALACIDQLGLILRAEIIWNKPNGLPESVTDRVRRSHETWFHLVKQPRYYSAVDEVREAHIYPDDNRHLRNGRRSINPDGSPGGGNTSNGNPLGKLPGSVWSIPSEPLTVPPELGVDHFAAYPTEWPRRIITGWSPPGICLECGEGRRPQRGMNWDVVPHRMEWRRNREPTTHERQECGELFTQWRGTHNRADFVPHFPHYKNDASVMAQISNWTYAKNIPMPDDLDHLEKLLGPAPRRLREIIGGMAMMPVVAEGIAVGPEGSGRHRNTLRNRPDVHSITGYVCGCPTPDAPTRPSVILDPFGGTGTVGLVADILGRHGITIDLSADYCRLAQWRTQDPGQRARAARVDKPPPVIDGQLALIPEWGGAV